MTAFFRLTLLVFAFLHVGFARGQEKKAEPTAKKDVKIYEVGKDGLKIEGTISKTDPPLKALKGAPHQVFLIKLQKGQNYIIDLTSEDFDSFLIIRDEKGKVLVYDDDGGEGLNSRLNWQAPADGTHRVLAASLDKKPGTFVLRVRTGALSEEEKLANKAEKLNKEGLALYRAQKGIEALEKFRTALAIREKLYPPARFPDGHPDLANSLNNLGAVLVSLGQVNKALRYHERALAVNQKLYPPARFPDGHRDLANSLHNVGAGLQSLDQASKTLPYYERALAMKEKLYPSARFPDGHPDLAFSLSKLGFVLNSLGQASKALPYHERALAMDQKLYPPARFPDGHRELAISLMHVGVVLESLGQASKALPYYERALAMQEKLYSPARFPDGHRDLATSLNNLGFLLDSLGQASKALPYSERALAMKEKLYPPARFPDGHPGLATSLTNLGSVLESLGQASKARPYYERALAMKEKLYPVARFPNGHTDLATSVHNLGFVLRSLGQASKAMPYCERALAMREKLYPPAQFPDGHSQLADSLNLLGDVLLSLGQANKVRPYCERALAICEKLYPPERFPDGHPDLARSLNSLGVLLDSLGQASKALPYFERAQAMKEKLYPPERFPDGHRALAQSLHNLGDVLRSLRQYGKALRAHERALAMKEKLYPQARFPDGHPDLARTLTYLGPLHIYLGEAPKALPYTERALAMLEKLYPPARFPDGHPDLATTLNNLGFVLYSLGQPSKSLPYLERALEMEEKLYPPVRFPDGKPHLANSLNNLGAVLKSLGQATKALPYYERALVMQRALIRREINVVSSAEALDYNAKFAYTRNGILGLASRLPGEASQRFYAQVWESKALVTRILQRRHEATRIALNTDEAVKKSWEKLQATRRDLAGLLGADPSKVADRDERIRALSDAKEKLETELAKLLPESARARELEKLGPKDLAERLPPDAVLLDFIRFGKQYVVFVLANGQAIQRLHFDDAAEIDQAVLAWRKEIQAGGASPAPKALAEMWGQIAATLPKSIRTIYLAADGDLARMPFAALPGKGKGTVLLGDYNLTQVPHAPFLLEQLVYPPSLEKTPRSSLAVGDVRYDFDGAKGVWPALKFTGPEVNQLAKIDAKRETKLLTGKEATVANVRRQLPLAGYAHFATHGFFDEDALTEDRKKLELAMKNWQMQSLGTQRVGLGLRNPLSFTGIVLGGANGGQKAGPDGGILSAEAIVDLPLEGLRLAVLSACETGLGELTEGEGVAGLQRAFHLAGCPNVIGSLWKVNDRATAALMNQFYHELWVNKKTPAEALRIAQLRIYRSPDAEMIAALAGERGRPALDKALRRPETTPTAGKHADTRLWAAFVLSGLGK